MHQNKPRQRNAGSTSLLNESTAASATATVWSALLVILCFAARLEAQPPAPIPPPDSAAQERMLAHAKAHAAKYSQDLPEFTCAQANFRNSDDTQGHLRPRSIVIVDLINHQTREQSGVEANIDLARLFRDLFSGDPQFRFDRWATLRGQRSAVFSTVSQNRQADIYANASTGAPARIVFRGFDTPAHFASYSCSVQLN